MNLMKKLFASVAVVAGLLAVPGAHAQTPPTQSCLDAAVIQCFDGCTNPLNLQECIIGCSAGGSNNPQACYDNCFGDAFCENKCLTSVAAVQSCSGPTSKVDVVVGAVTLNRSTGLWQQVVKMSNNTPFETLRNLVVVLNDLKPGWTLSNQDGTTIALPSSGSPYRNVGTALAPAATTTVLLLYSRTGNASFGVTPMVFASDFR